MWFIFITARLFIFLSFQPRLAATLLRSCSVVNSLTRRAGLSPAFQPTSLAQRLIRCDWCDRSCFGRAEVLLRRADVSGGAAAPPYRLARHTDSRWIHLTGGCSDNFL